MKFPYLLNRSEQFLVDSWREMSHAEKLTVYKAVLQHITSDTTAGRNITLDNISAEILLTEHEK